jgi:hypothetical protein
MRDLAPTDEDITLLMGRELSAPGRAQLTPAVLGRLRAAARHQMPACFYSSTLRIVAVEDRSHELVPDGEWGRELRIRARAVSEDALTIAEPVFFTFEFWERAASEGAIVTSVGVVRGSAEVPIGKVVHETHERFMPRHANAHVFEPGRHLSHAFGPEQAR